MGTYSSVLSFLMPSHSLSFFCLTPFWVNHLWTREETTWTLETRQDPFWFHIPKNKHTEVRVTIWLSAILTWDTGLWSCGAGWGLAWCCSSSCRFLCSLPPASSDLPPVDVCCLRFHLFWTSTSHNCPQSYKRNPKQWRISFKEFLNTFGANVPDVLPAICGSWRHILTSGSPCRCLLSWTSRYTLCCTALVFGIAPQRSL